MCPRGCIFKWLLKTPFSIWIQGRDSRKGLGFNEGRKKRRKGGVQGRKEQKGKICVCMHMHQAGPHHKFTRGQYLRGEEESIKGREEQGRAGNGREEQGRAGKGRAGYLQPSPTSVHTLPIPIWTPPCPGVDPSPRHTPPSQIIGPPTEVNVNETTSLGTWWSSTSVLKKKTLDGIRHRLLRYFCHFHRLLRKNIQINVTGK